MEPGLTARFAYPMGSRVDASGNIYVADRTNHTIRKVTPAGNVTTFAGLANTPGTTDGTGSAARFSSPQGIAVDSAGTVYVADGSNTIRTITPAGVVTTLAGLAGRKLAAPTEPAVPRDSVALEELPSTARVTRMWRTPTITRSGKLHPAAS